METAIMMGVGGCIFLALIAIGGAVYHTIRNKRLVDLIDTEYDEAMGHFDQETITPFDDGSVSLELFFTKQEKIGKTVKFYASAPSIGVEIPIDGQIDCDYDEVCAYVDSIYDNTDDNFFVLEDSKGNCIQFFHDGINENLEIDIPVAAEKGSYKGEFSNLRDVKTCIRSFFSGVDVAFNYPVTFEEW